MKIIKFKFSDDQTKNFHPMNIEILIEQILNKIPRLNKSRKNFFVHIITMFLSVRGKINFSQLARYGKMQESSYRLNFKKEFDFRSFNLELIQETMSEDKIVVFDPTFIPKSGKSTVGIAYFWSGCASRAERGLEFGGFGAVDITNNTAMHLIGNQTLFWKEEGSLLDYYAGLVQAHAPEMVQISKYLAADAYFAKKPFVEAVSAANMFLVTRLRKDSRMQYPYIHPRIKRRGRPTKFSGKVDCLNLNLEYFSICIKEADFIVYEATVWVTAFKRWCRVAVVHYLDEQGAIQRVKTFCSTDTSMSGIDLFLAYKARYQIEFLYRDGKQHTGLADCQARSADKIHFHLNASLTAVSIAKAAHWYSLENKNNVPFSMANIKTRYFNQLMLDLFFNTFGICPNKTFNQQLKAKLLQFGRIAA